LAGDDLRRVFWGLPRFFEGNDCAVKLPQQTRVLDDGLFDIVAHVRLGHERFNVALARPESLPESLRRLAHIGQGDLRYKIVGNGSGRYRRYGLVQIENGAPIVLTALRRTSLVS
jgi:hypothetical protein